MRGPLINRGALKIPTALRKPFWRTQPAPIC